MKYLKELPKKLLFDGCKLFWYADRLEKWLKGEKVMPITIDMGIHKGCNMACQFCYGVYQHKSADYIPTHNLLQLSKDARKADIKGIAIVGDGEPTLNIGLYPFVSALTDNGVDSAVATNGLLLDDRKVDILVENCSWLRFNVSATEDKYPVIHKGTNIEDFRKLERLITYAVEHKGSCTIGLQMVLIPDNFDQIIPWAKWAVKLGVNYAQIKQFSDAGIGMPMHFDMSLYKQTEQILKKAEGLSNDKTEIKIKWKALEDSRNITMESKWDFEKCIDLPFLFQISGNGKCYPCGYLFNNEKRCYGDITKESLYSILNSDKYWGIINDIGNTRLKDLCQGQCRHCSSNQFVDRLVKVYKGDIKEALVSLCGSEKQYKLLMDNPPNHISFL